VFFSETLAIKQVRWLRAVARNLLSNKLAGSERKMSTTLIVGYDPGGDGAHGVAVSSVSEGKPESVRCHTFRTAHEVIDYLDALGAVVAIGVDTLTCWSTGSGGWRPADRWLRERYKDVRNSVMTPNGLAGSMGLNGMSVLISARTKNPDVFVVETHPKVLYWALTKKKYNYHSMRADMELMLCEAHAVALTTANEHEWDAALSALAAARGYLRTWRVDLHALPTVAGERLISPCGQTNYYWPEP
jgi:predicted nuclease with RNAse H fold